MKEVSFFIFLCLGRVEDVDWKTSLVRKQISSKINVFAAIRASSYSTFFPWRSQTQSLLPGKFLNVERNVLVNICTTHEIESYVNVHPRAGVDGMEEAINDWASELNFIEVQCKSF